MEMRLNESAAAAAEDSNAASRMQFSESMTKTKNAVSKCGINCFFCFCVQSTDESEDKYTQQILNREIETLKRTIKEVVKEISSKYPTFDLVNKAF